MPVAVVVVKSRLLDVAKSLETTPEENLLMARETIACLQDHGLEVFVDFEHAMDAVCGRRENGEPCDADFSKRSLDYFHQITEQCVGQEVSRLVLCDTTGGASPEEVTQLFAGPDASPSRMPSLDFMATPIAGWALPIRGRRSSRARCRCRARCWEPESAAAM